MDSSGSVPKKIMMGLFVYTNTRVCGSVPFGERNRIFFGRREKRIHLDPFPIPCKSNEVVPERYGILGSVSFSLVKTGRRGLQLAKSALDRLPMQRAEMNMLTNTI